jgi:hypothetical protein
LSWYFSAYGLQLRADGPIPGLLTSPEPAQVDVAISLQGTPQAFDRNLEAAEDKWRSSSTDESGRPVLQIKQAPEGAYLRFLYCDGAEFVLDGTGTGVWASWPEKLTLGDVLPYLRGPVLGAVLRLRNVVALHASAISIDGHAIALMGPPEAGKSTTAAAFARLGCPVLSDDVVALKDGIDTFLAEPGYPNLCLWPESVSALYGSEDALPRITENWEKRYLDLTEKGHEFAREALPLAGIYILAERSPDPQAPFIEPVTGSACLIELIANTYVSYLSDSSMRSRDFELLGRVAAHVPIRRVIPHADPTQLSTLCDRILEDAQTLIPSLVA